MSDEYDAGNNDSVEELTPDQILKIFWLLAAFVIAIISCVYNNSTMVLTAGFFVKSFAVVVGTILGFIGACMGDAIRKFAMPDAFFSSGMIDTIKTKLFWFCGPQLIGLFIGVFLGMSLVLS